MAEIKTIPYFPTFLWSRQLNLDLKDMKKYCLDYQKSVAQLNHLSSKNEIISAFDPLKDGDFGRRIEKYARKSF